MRIRNIRTVAETGEPLENEKYLMLTAKGKGDTYAELPEEYAGMVVFANKDNIPNKVTVTNPEIDVPIGFVGKIDNNWLAFDEVEVSPYRTDNIKLQHKLGRATIDNHIEGEHSRQTIEDNLTEEQHKYLQILKEALSERGAVALDEIDTPRALTDIIQSRDILNDGRTYFIIRDDFLIPDNTALDMPEYAHKLPWGIGYYYDEPKDQSNYDDLLAQLSLKRYSREDLSKVSIDVEETTKSEQLYKEFKDNNKGLTALKGSMYVDETLRNHPIINHIYPKVAIKDLMRNLPDKLDLKSLIGPEDNTNELIRDIIYVKGTGLIITIDWHTTFANPDYKEFEEDRVETYVKPSEEHEISKQAGKVTDNIKADYTEHYI